MNCETRLEAEMLKKVALLSAATALAINVLPLPSGDHEYEDDASNIGGRDANTPEGQWLSGS